MSIITTHFPLLAQANTMTRINNEVAAENHRAVMSDFDTECDVDAKIVESRLAADFSIIFGSNLKQCEVMEVI